MTAAVNLTCVVYLAFAGLLAAASFIDARRRIIPNKLVASLALLWAVWRAALSACALSAGMSWGEAANVAAPSLELGGFALFGATLTEGLVGAVALGGGMLLLSVLYESLTHKASFGGGDLKLLAALGLFLGWERGVVCLLIACVFSLLVFAGRALVKRSDISPDSPASSSWGTFAFGPYLALGAVIALFF